MSKICNTCNIEKLPSEFHAAAKNKDGRQNICKLCEKNRKRLWYVENKELTLSKQKDYYSKNKDVISERCKIYRDEDYPINLEKYMLRRAKQRAIKKNLDFNITIEDIQIPEFCPILGLKLSVSKRNDDKSKSPSLDRIDSTLGYIKGNVWVISNLANTMKSCATDDQLQNFARWVLTREFTYDTIRALILELKERHED